MSVEFLQFHFPKPFREAGGLDGEEFLFLSLE